MDKLALNIFKMVLFVIGMVCDILAKIVTDPDMKMNLEMRSLSMMTLFGNPEMIPEEILKPVLTQIKIAIIAIPIISIWVRIIKPLVFGG
jgi:hypothetical protein